MDIARVGLSPPSDGRRSGVLFDKALIELWKEGREGGKEGSLHARDRSDGGNGGTLRLPSFKKGPEINRGRAGYWSDR